LVGASPNSAFHSRVVGNAERLGFRGRLLPVNPSRTEVFGLPCAPSVSALDEPVDLVAIGVSGARAEEVVVDALEADAKAFVMYTAGLGEAGLEGRERQARIVELCGRSRVTLLGPNGLGLLNAHIGAPTFGADIADLEAGPIGLIAQSGSAAIATLQSGRRLGFSIAASSGNEAVVTAEDLMEVLLEDEGTGVVGMFLEGLRDGRRFRSLMQRAEALGKPVVALTVGASAPARSVVATHTGRLAGDHRVVRSALRDLGVMVVSNFDEMVETLYLLTRRSGRTVGRRVGLVALSGGELSMATDAAYAAGLETPAIAGETVARITRELGYPSDANVSNPMDLAGTPGADGEGMLEARYAGAVAALVDDASVETVLVVQDSGHQLSPSLIDWYMGAARGLVRVAASSPKPILVVNPLSADVTPRFRDFLEDGEVPVLRGLAPGIRALSEVAHRRAVSTAPSLDGLGATLERWTSELAADRREPDERDVKQLLAACGIEVVEDSLCDTAEAAAECALQLGFPVVLKIVSPTILHKSEVGGVRLGLGSEAEVMRAFDEILRSAHAAQPDAEVRGVLVAPQLSGGCELVVGAFVDPTFGPMVMVGLGGVFVEAIEDVAFALAPASEATVHGMLRQLKGSRLLDGFRGAPPVERDAVVRAVVRLSTLIASGDHVVESIEINPLVANDRSATALDARIVLRPGCLEPLAAAMNATT
jgi:acyl-CoA synthetase (NDP forming)